MTVAADENEDIVYPSSIPFLLLHLACAGVVVTGVTWQAACLCAALYAIRMFAIGAAYHRYFSHRAFSTSRLFQFVLAFLAQSSAQRGVLWWAAKHRHHHLHADTPEDVHSPAQHGFFYAHVGWIFARRHDGTDLIKIRDFARFAELRWLNRFELVPPVALAALSYLIAGWSGLVVGFVWSTVLLYHATFAINSFAHTHGSRQFLTGDDSRNNWLLALLTFGEGWHNNHHAFQSSARQGFRWWEIDLTFYGLVLLSGAGVVWDLKAPPARLQRGEERRIKGKVLDRVALRLALSFPIEDIVTGAKLDVAARLEVERFVASSLVSFRRGQLQALPAQEDLRQRASTMFVKTSFVDDIVARARVLMCEALTAGLAECARSSLAHGSGLATADVLS